jgi:deazaflavin-dependent oxidoreductase (nitroreductase family)
MNIGFKLFVGAHVGIYRLTKGRVGGSIGGQKVVLLTTTGRTTGKARTVPVGSFEDGADRIVVASFAGSPRHPAWFNNLTANPDVKVQLGGRVYAARARVTAGEERERLWRMVVAAAPGFADYQRKAGERTIPLVRLEEQAAR